MHKEEALNLCKKHMHKYVLVQTKDGMHYDGIIAYVDDEHVHLAVPAGWEENMPHMHMRALTGYPGYGPWYGYPGYYGYGYPYYGGRRFRRLVLPLAALAAISLLPYF